MVHRPYRPCRAIAESSGRRCKALALPLEDTCVLHLPFNNSRRVRAIEDQRRRVRAYWDRWRAEKAAKEAA